MADRTASDARASARAAPSREARTAEAFEALAESTAAGRDLLDTLTERCVALLSVAGAGVILLDDDEAKIVTASAEPVHSLLQLELQLAEGPGTDCRRSATPVIDSDLIGGAGRWPRYTPRARTAGFAAVSAVPMQMHGRTVGVLQLFHARSGELEPDAVRIGQSLVAVTTALLLQERAIEHGLQLSEQLQNALNSRVVIEQAKGILARHGGAGWNVDTAFASLRSYSQNQHHKISDLAGEIVAGKIDLDVILDL